MDWLEMTLSEWPAELMLAVRAREQRRLDALWAKTEPRLDDTNSFI